MNAFAASGRTGTLLLDPTNIEIVAAGADTAALTAVDEFGDPDLGANNTTRIDVTALNAALANVVLQATNDITFSTDVTITTGVGLTAIANNNIFLNGNLTTNFGAITLQADADNSGSGGVIAGGGTTLQTQGGPVTIMGAGLQLGAIDTSAVLPGAVSLMSTGDITFDAIAATTTSADPGGDVNIVANGTVQGLSAGITINALPILRNTQWQTGDLPAAYEANIIGGPNAFVMPAQSGPEFTDAVKRKLILEIAGTVPDTDFASVLLNSLTQTN